MEPQSVLTAADLADAIGRRRIAETLGVGPTAVSNHVVRGRFPAGWLSALRSLADEAGIMCPDALFSMRSLRRAAPSPQTTEAAE